MAKVLVREYDTGNLKEVSLDYYGDMMQVGNKYEPANQESADKIREAGWGKQVEKAKAKTETQQGYAAKALEANAKYLGGLIPEYESFLDKSGKLPEQYSLKSPESIAGKVKETIDPYTGFVTGNAADQLQQGAQDIDYLRNEATSTSNSPFAQAQLDLAKLQGIQSQEDLGKAIAGQRAEAMSELARQGGLESGARERLIESTGNTAIDQAQEARRAEQEAALGITSDMYKRRESLQEALPSLSSSMATAYGNMATTGASLQNPYLSALSTDQANQYDTSKYNLNTLITEASKKAQTKLDKGYKVAELTANQAGLMQTQGKDKYASVNFDPYQTAYK